MSDVLASPSLTLRSLGTWHVWKPYARESGDPGRLHNILAGIGESNRQKPPGNIRDMPPDIKHGTQKQSMNGYGWTEKGEKPYSQFKMPPEVGHNIVPKKLANKDKTAEQVEGRT